MFLKVGADELFDGNDLLKQLNIFFPFKVELYDQLVIR